MVTIDGKQIPDDVFEYMRGKGVGFTRLRRITGYLVGQMDLFNDAKKAEVHDRVKHVTKGDMNDGH